MSFKATDLLPRARSNSNPTQIYSRSRNKSMLQKEVIDEFTTKMKILSGKEILSNIPSIHDTKRLYSIIPKTVDVIKKNQTIKEMLFHEFKQFYRVKMSFLTNVTHLPRYKHYFQNNKMSKKLCIVVRHELWIGDLKYDTTTFETDYRIKTSDGMRFSKGSDGFFQSKQKWCDLARESCISFTVFLCKLKPGIKDDDIQQNGVHDEDNNKKNGKNKNKSIYDEEIPIAFARLPIIDVRSLLRDGKYALNLWPIPIYIAEYKGAKCDPYINLAFRYRGSTTCRHFKRVRTASKVDKLTGNDESDRKQLQNIFKLGVEFESRKFKVIAPPLNYRINYKALHLKREAKMLSRRETEMLTAATAKEEELVSRKPSWFGLGKSNGKQKEKDRRKAEEKQRKNEEKKKREEELRKKKEWERVHRIVNRDILYEYTDRDKELLWEYRDDLVKLPNSLNCFLKCI